MSTGSINYDMSASSFNQYTSQQAISIHGLELFKGKKLLKLLMFKECFDLFDFKLFGAYIMYCNKKPILPLLRQIT